MRNLKWPYIPILFYYVLYLYIKVHACSIKCIIRVHIGWANYVILLRLADNFMDVYGLYNSLIF